MKTFFDRVWESHVVKQMADGVSLLYVDLHLVHEVTSPQAFAGLRREGRTVRRPHRTLATVDHNVPTGDRSSIPDPVAALQLDALATNTKEFGIELFDLESPGQGIVHVIGPEMGATQPGMVVVCGDSHTSTHGAFGAFALGIGTTEVEHVLATQCLVLSKPRTMEARFTGRRSPGVTAKDLILALIGRIGTAGATGHVLRHPRTPPRPRRFGGTGRAAGGGAGARLHGARARDAARGAPDPAGVRGIVHERADRGPAGGRAGGARPEGGVGRARDGRPR